MSNSYVPDITALIPGDIARSVDINDRYDYVIAGFDRLPEPKVGEAGFSAPVPVGTPVNDDHAVTKLWAETAMSSELATAITQATNAANSASAAAASAAAAASDAANVATMVQGVEIYVDNFTGNGATKTFILGLQVDNPEQLAIYFDGVYQNKSGYSVFEATLTFVTAPPNGVSIEVLTYTGGAYVIGEPSNYTVTSAKLAGDLVTPGDLTVTGTLYGNTTITATSKAIVSGETCYVTAAGQTITLPAAPSLGDNVRIGVGDFNDTIIARNNTNIMGVDEDMTINSANATVSLMYVNPTLGWRII